MLLKGKNICITGAGRGIGRAVAIACAKEGANLGLTSRTLDELSNTKKDIEAINTDVKIVVKAADVTKYEDLARAFKGFHEELGVLNGIIANAGASGKWASHEFDSEKFSFIVNVNITGVFNTFKAAYPYLKKDDKNEKARFLITGSVAYPNAMPQFAAYTASKYGVVGLLKELVLEYKKENITFNMILPTMVDTRLLRGKKAGDGQKPDNVMNPEDLNDFYLFFMSGDSNKSNDQLVTTTDFEVVKKLIKEAPSEKRVNIDAFKGYLEEKAPKTYDNIKKSKELVEYFLKRVK